MAVIQTLCPNCLTPNRVEQGRLTDGPRCGKCHKPLFTGQPIAADDPHFQQLLGKEQLPLVVDFWADWCGPCKAMAPVFAKAAAEFEPAARFIKLDTERATNAATQWHIRSIPTLMIFKQGAKVAQQAGAMSQPQLLQWLKTHL